MVVNCVLANTHYVKPFALSPIKNQDLIHVKDS